MQRNRNMSRRRRNRNRSRRRRSRRRVEITEVAHRRRDTKSQICAEQQDTVT
jgi:hypothetical protein